MLTKKIIIFYCSFMVELNGQRWNECFHQLLGTLCGKGPPQPLSRSCVRVYFSCLFFFFFFKTWTDCQSRDMKNTASSCAYSIQQGYIYFCYCSSLYDGWNWEMFLKIMFCLVIRRMIQCLPGNGCFAGRRDRCSSSCTEAEADRRQVHFSARQQVQFSDRQFQSNHKTKEQKCCISILLQRLVILLQYIWDVRQ